MIWKIPWKFGEDLTWFGWESLSWELGGHWGFLIGDFEDGIIFDIIDHVSRWLGRYPESLIKIGYDLAEKKFVPRSGWGWCWGVGVGFFSNFKDRFKLIKKPNPNPTRPVDKLFLNQIMSYLYQTSRISSWSSINMIYGVKNDIILQVSNQEPSISFKHPTLASSNKSCWMFTKLSGYLPIHL